MRLEVAIEAWSPVAAKSPKWPKKKALPSPTNVFSGSPSDPWTKFLGSLRGGTPFDVMKTEVLNGVDWYRVRVRRASCSRLVRKTSRFLPCGFDGWRGISRSRNARVAGSVGWLRPSVPHVRPRALLRQRAMHLWGSLDSPNRPLGGNRCLCALVLRRRAVGCLG
jgi:hypothetical protein